MSHKTLIALSALAALACGLGSGLSPAMANYSYCTENPSAVGCPGNFDVTKEAFYTPPQHHRTAQHETRNMSQHRG